MQPQHTTEQLKSFKKRQEQEREAHEKTRRDPDSLFNKSLRFVERNRPAWTKVKGVRVLRINGSKYVAAPNKKQQFDIIDVEEGSYICQVHKNKLNHTLLSLYAQEVDPYSF